MLYDTELFHAVCIKAATPKTGVAKAPLSVFLLYSIGAGTGAKR
jgi:hypothetical protein